MFRFQCRKLPPSHYSHWQTEMNLLCGNYWSVCVLITRGRSWRWHNVMWQSRVAFPRCARARFSERLPPHQSSPPVASALTCCHSWRRTQANTSNTMSTARAAAGWMEGGIDGGMCGGMDGCSVCISSPSRPPPARLSTSPSGWAARHRWTLLPRTGKRSHEILLTLLSGSSPI